MDIRLAVYLIATVTRVLGIDTISLVVSLPLHNCITQQDTSWTREVEILTGAYIAVNDINNDSSILSNYNLELKVLDVSRDEQELLWQFTNVTFRQPSLNIVGICGILSPKLVPLLLRLSEQKRITATLTAGIFIPGHCDTFLSMDTSPVMASVLLSFVQRMNWDRVGLITEGMDAYLFSVAETLLQTNETVTFFPYIQLLNIKSDIHSIIDSNTRVIIVSLHVHKAAQLMCVIHEMGLNWPQYAWIFHSYRIKDILVQPVACNLETAIEGILVIENHLMPNISGTKLSSGITFSSYHEQYLSSLSMAAAKNNLTLRPNEYTKILYDLVWSTALMLNQSCNQNTSCTNYH